MTALVLTVPNATRMLDEDRVSTQPQSTVDPMVSITKIQFFLDRIIVS